MTYNKESKWKDLQNLVTEAFQGKIKTMSDTQDNTQPSFTSIEHYTQVTGKRFRMLKEQKARNLTREQAFAEIYLNGNSASAPVEEPPTETNS